MRRHDSRERRLARPGGAVQHHRVRIPLLDGGPERRALAEQVRLADEVLKTRRADPDRQGAPVAGLARLVPPALPLRGLPSRAPARLITGILAKQGVHLPSISRRTQAWRGIGCRRPHDAPAGPRRRSWADPPFTDPPAPFSIFFRAHIFT